MKIYIVRGSTGEYSDRYEWLVAAYRDEDLAKEHVEKASEQARVAFAEGSRYEAEEKYRNALDPNFHMDYTGTNYYYEEVSVLREVPRV